MNLYGWYRQENETESQKAARNKPKKRLFNRPMSYAERDAFVRELGFASYHDYLESDRWASIRDRVLGKTRRCCICHRRGKATQVHHSSYTRENLAGRSLRGLKPVCPGCHVNIEFDGDEKLDQAAVRKKAKRLRRSKKYAKGARQIARENGRL